MHFLDEFAERAKNYIAQSNINPVFPVEAAILNLKMFDTELQQESINAHEVLAFLDDIGSPATVKSTGGRYFGFVTGGSLPAAMSAKLMASVWDQNSCLTVMSPISSAI